MIGGQGPSTPEAKRLAGVYQGAVESVLALLLAIGAGWWADRKFQTGSRYLMLGVVVGFASFVLRLWRMRKLVEPAPDQTDPGNSE
jgi:hypothetical protein